MLLFRGFRGTKEFIYESSVPLWNSLACNISVLSLRTTTTMPARRWRRVRENKDAFVYILYLKNSSPRTYNKE